ncbi:MAG: GDP-mannose 4,6-dehydratase, partial [Hyphomonas sp.]|nr:GDP-mannose 4,6-dehydratase [Hyphomonas sp.]
KGGAFYGGLYVVGVVTAFITAVYTMRMLVIVFGGEQNYLHPDPLTGKGTSLPRTMEWPLIPLALLNALEGLPLPVYGDGRQVRDWLFVDDHARALIALLERGRPGETYAVGGRSERRNLDVVQAICDLLDARAPLPGGKPRRSLIAFVEDRPGHDRRYAIDPSKIETELGWRAAESFESGLARTLDWYLTNPGWWQPIRKNSYAGQRLGQLPA